MPDVQARLNKTVSALCKVRFVLFSDNALDAYKTVLATLIAQRDDLPSL